MADDQPKANYHSRDEINDFVRRNYQDLSNVKDKDIAIGAAGGTYLVGVTDAFKVIHHLKIPREAVEADLVKGQERLAAKSVTSRARPPKSKPSQAEAKAIAKTAANFDSHRSDKSKDNDRER